MNNKALLATECGVQVPFEVKMFSLRELGSMRTATTNEQSPLDFKRNETLSQDLASSGQLEPFTVLLFDDDYYLGAGRNRLHCQTSMLNRPLDMQFACLVYKVDSIRQVNHAILAKNNSRKPPKQEKQILYAAGQTGKHVGKESLSEDYALMISGGQLKEAKALFLTETSAKLINNLAGKVDITGTTIIQVVNSIWANIFNTKKFKTQIGFFYIHPDNIYAMQQAWLDVIPDALDKCIKLNPYVRSWAREGKQFLIDAAIKAVGDKISGDFKFPIIPQSEKQTVSKAKTTATSTPERTIKVVVAAESVPVVEPVKTEEEEAIPF